MDFVKVMKDRTAKFLLGKSLVPNELVELQRYFRLYGPIRFQNHPEEGGVVVSTSTNFQYGSIITSGKTPKELDRNIKDAILTSFGIPSAYKEEADIKAVRKGEVRENEYALI